MASTQLSPVLLLTRKGVRSLVHGVRLPPPFDNLRDEVNAIMRWWSIYFSCLICCFCGQDWWGELPQKGQQASGRGSYAVSP